MTAAIAPVPDADDETPAPPRLVLPPSRDRTPSPPTQQLPSVQQAIAQVIAEMPAVGKDQRNEQQNFSYRGIDDVLAALKPCVGRAGVVIVPTVEHRETSERPTRSGGILFVVTLGIRYRIYGPAGDFLEAFVWGEGTDSGDKATQKAMTGAYKYLLFELFCVAGQAEGDADATHPGETVKDWFFENGWRADPKIEGDTPQAAQKRAYDDVVERARKLPSDELRADLKAWLASEKINLGAAISTDEYRKTIEKIKELTPPADPVSADAPDQAGSGAEASSPAPAAAPATEPPPNPSAASQAPLPEDPAPATSTGDEDDEEACPICLGPTKRIDPECWACDGRGTVAPSQAKAATDVEAQKAAAEEGDDERAKNGHPACTICGSTRAQLVEVHGVLRCSNATDCKARAAKRQEAAKAQLDAAKTAE